MFNSEFRHVQDASIKTDLTRGSTRLVRFEIVGRSFEIVEQNFECVGRSFEFVGWRFQIVEWRVEIVG